MSYNLPGIPSVTLTTSNDALKSLTHRHEAIMETMLVYPEIPLKELAVAFNVSQSWLSTVIHSDAFQARFEQLRSEKRERTLFTIEEKMLGLAHAAIEKLGEKLEETESPEFVKSTAESVLDRLGYGTKAQGGITINPGNGSEVHITPVSKDTIHAANRARERLHQLVEGEVIDAEAERIPAGGEHPIGSTGEETTKLHTTGETDRGEEGGDQIRSLGPSALCDALESGDV